jgi:flagellar hook-basal body complex protein FliE
MEPVPINSDLVKALGEADSPVLKRLGSAQPGFRETLERYIQDVNSLQVEADKAVRNLVTGKMDNFHEVIVAMSEADLSFRLMMQMRNKLVDAYKEIMRMQV